MDRLNGLDISHEGWIWNIGPVLPSISDDVSELLSWNDAKAIYSRLKLMDNPPIASKNDLKDLYKKGLLPDEFFSMRKWSILAEPFNASKNNIFWYGFRLPVSYPWLISALWWDIRISWKKSYVLELLYSD